MNKIIEIIKKYNVLIIFLLFFSLVLIEHHFLWLQFDDYGYSSLSYAYNVENISGTNYGLGDIITFLIGHYNVWGGRILFFFFEIICLKGGLSVYRVFQSIAIAIIFFFMYLLVNKYVKKDVHKTFLAIFITLLYGVFSIVVINSGIMWITASVLYLVPIAFFLPFVYLLDKYQNHKFKKKAFKVLSIIGLSLLIFISAFSQEQLSAMAVFYIIAYTAYNWFKEKKINRDNIIFCIIALIGFGILMMAPGSRNRMGESSDFYSLSLIGKILVNFPQLVSVNFSMYYNRFFVMILFIVNIYLSINNVILKKGFRVINIISLISVIIMMSISLFTNQFYFDYITQYYISDIVRNIFSLVVFLQLLLFIYSTVVYFYNRKQLIPCILVLSAYVSQAILLYSPTMPNRVVIPFEVLYFVIFAYTFANMLSESKRKIGLFVIIGLAIASGLNFSSVLVGYYKNDSINSYNDRVLRENADQIKNGKDVKVIKLKRLKDDTYSTSQPYMVGSEYILVWIREYYDIPDKIEIIYE